MVYHGDQKIDTNQDNNQMQAEHTKGWNSAAFVKRVVRILCDRCVIGKLKLKLHSLTLQSTLTRRESKKDQQSVEFRMWIIQSMAVGQRLHIHTHIEDTEL